MKLCPRTVSVDAVTVLGAETFKRHVSEVARVRHWVAGDVASDLGLTGDALDTITLCVSECVTNAVRYGDAGDEIGVIVVRRCLDDARPSAVRVEVIDSGNTGQDAPHMRSADPHAYGEKGRGLAIVGALTAAWGHQRDRDGSGHVVWFEVQDAR